MSGTGGAGVTGTDNLKGEPPHPMNIFDLSYQLQGDSLPLPYAPALWTALLGHWPALGDGPAGVGVVPLRGAQQHGRLWLARRTRLVLRLPEAWCSAATQLCQQRLEGDDLHLTVGALLDQRPLSAAPSLHAQAVRGPCDELTFLDWAGQQLHDLGIEGQLICGRAQAPDARGSTMRSLVVHHLRPDHALQLQQVGLGPERHLGHGLFVPCKTIPNLN